METNAEGSRSLTRRSLIREADLRRLVKVVRQEAPGARMTVDLVQNRLHFVLSDTPADPQEEGSPNPLDWLLNGNDTQSGAPKI
jgi:hypothetical protein